MSAEIHTLRNNFNGGEMSPLLDGRVESEKYQSGCRILENMIVRPHGGAFKRPGTQFCGRAKEDEAPRLHGFKRSTQTNYVLEFGHQYIRFWKGGVDAARLTVDRDEVAVWDGLKTRVQWTERSYTAGEYVTNLGINYMCYLGHAYDAALQPGVGASSTSYWRLLTTTTVWAKYVSYTLHQVVVNNGVYYICLSTHTSDDDWGPGFGAGWQSYWRVVSNYTFLWSSSSVLYGVGDKVSHGGTIYRCILAHTSASGTAPGASDDWSVYWEEIAPYKIGDLVKEGPNVYYCSKGHLPGAAFDPAEGWAFMEQIGATDQFIFEVPTGYQLDEVFELQFIQLNDVLFSVHPSHPPMRLSRKGETEWEFVEMPFQFAPVLDVNEDRVSVQLQFDDVPDFGLGWDLGKVYEVGDRVHGVATTPTNVVGCVYECILGHTASSANNPGGANTGTYWSQISSAGYAVGDRVTAVDVGSTANPYNGQVFTCHTAFVPTAADANVPGMSTGVWKNYWNEGTSKIKIPNWVGGTLYAKNALVRNRGQIYKAKSQHRAAAPMTSPTRGGVIVAPGNAPGVSKNWAKYWQITRSDTDLSGLNFALHATSDLFVMEDVGTQWLLEIGTGGIFEEISVGAAAGSAGTTEANPLFVQGGYRVATSWNSEDALVGTLTVEESLDNVTWQTVRQFTQSGRGEGNIDFSGEAPTTGAWYRISAKRTTAGTAACKMKIEATSSVYKLPFRIASFDDATKVSGNLVMPGDQLPPYIAIGVATSIFRKPAFCQTSGYPRAVAFHDSRLWFGGTRTHPTRIWASQTEDYYNFLTGSLDTDGLDLTLAARESNAIQWLASFNRSLVIGTAGDEWTLDSGETDEGLKPTNLRARLRTRYGSCGIPPQLTGESLLWPGRNKRSIYEFAYNFQSDAYTAPDMTLFAEHVLGPGVRQMAFQSSIEPILWCVIGNGTLAGLSYNREQQVVAWHRHYTAQRGSLEFPSEGFDRFESVAVIYGEQCDEVWFTVSRKFINAFTDEIETRYYIERFNPRLMAWLMGAPYETLLPKDVWAFCDSALTVASNAGLDHLNGYLQTDENLGGGALSGAVVWGGGGRGLDNTAGSYVYDGSVYLVPSGWTFPLTFGFPIHAYLVTPRLEAMLQTGTAQGRKVRMNRMILRVWRSDAGSWSLMEDGNQMTEIYIRDRQTKIVYADANNPLSSLISISSELPVVAADNSGLPYLTGQLAEISLNGTPSYNPQLVFSSHESKPFNVLAVILKVEIGGE